MIENTLLANLDNSCRRLTARPGRAALVTLFPLLFACAGCVGVGPGRHAAPDSAVQDALAVLAKNHAGLQRLVLDNGMVCLVKEDHSAPIVAIQVWVGAGAIHEDHLLGAGLSHALEHMVFKGTPTRGLGAITREINDAGGDINAYTGSDRTVFLADMPAARWTVGLDVLADAVMRATFPEDEWKKERDVILREIAMGKDNPERELDKLLNAAAYTMHPYRFPVIGREDIFKRLARDDILAYFRRHYVPENMIVAVVGDFRTSDARQQIEDVFRGFEARARPAILIPAEPPQLAPRFRRKTGAYNVSRLEWAYHTTPLSHPDTPALDLLAQIVGAGRSSRLNCRLREELQLAHNVGASSYTPREPGVFSIGAEFDPAKEADLLAAIQEEVASWLRGRFTGHEIARARRQMLNSELFKLQTMRGQADNLASGEFYAADARFSETYLRLLFAVTPDELTAVARRHLRPENRTLAILSPAGAERAAESAPGQALSAAADRLVLSNGIPLILREDHRLPFVSISVVMGGGLLSENERNTGITQLLGALLTRGTASCAGREIAETHESLGASLASFSGRNSFGLNAHCLARDTDTVVDLLADCLLNASFPEEELAKQKAVQIAAIDAQREDPMFIAQENLRNLLFPKHPYRWNLLGSRETVKAVTRDDLLQRLRQHRVTGNMVAAVFGDVTPARARELAERALCGVPAGMKPALTFERTDPCLPARTERVEPREQAIFLAGYPGVDAKDPRCDALGIVHTALSGLSSDLGVAVREKLGLAYFVGASQLVGVEPGAFFFYAGVSENKIADVEALARKEAGRIAAAGLRLEEIARARNQIVTKAEAALQDPGDLAMSCALNELYGLGHLHSFTTRKRLEALTAQDIRRAAASILAPDKMAVSVVLPEKKNKPAQSGAPSAPKTSE
ncbi:MAG: pitrilysin family protein [Verrucomicrobiota bacterium]|nr:pitrilysin family protein [Verrucomicrobiota bacterium]